MDGIQTVLNVLLALDAARSNRAEPVTLSGKTFDELVAFFTDLAHLLQQHEERLLELERQNAAESALGAIEKARQR